MAPKIVVRVLAVTIHSSKAAVAKAPGPASSGKESQR
jgi:hypothetical protein